MLWAHRGLGPADRALLRGIHSSWIGVKEKHLRLGAGKGGAKKAIGVMVYAIDRSRVEPILAAIRREIVSHVVTEMRLAVQLKRLARQELPPGRRWES